jgi:VanZ family protein
MVMGDDMKTRVICLFFIVIWGGILFLFTESTLFTGSSTRQVISSIYSLFQIENTAAIIDSSNFYIRKTAHFCFFGLLAVLLWRALTPLIFAFPISWLLTTMYGAADEWHQSFQPGRTSSIDDVLLDSFGAITFLSIAALVSKLWRRQKIKMETNQKGV